MIKFHIRTHVGTQGNNTVQYTQHRHQNTKKYRTPNYGGTETQNYNKLQWLLTECCGYTKLQKGQGLQNYEMVQRHQTTKSTGTLTTKSYSDTKLQKVQGFQTKKG